MDKTFLTTANERIVWSSSNDLSIDGVSFFATVDPALYHTRQSSEESFLIVKSREMIERELALIRHIDVKNIVDIGVWQGGSVALLDLVFNPNKLVAIEYSARELPTLDTYIRERSREANISVNKGVDQADFKTLEKILSREFKDDSIDLVIDDASHQYLETKASFNVLFPKIRENGVFIVEDWRWSTRPVHYNSDYFKGKVGLSNLILQCMLLCGQRPDIIKSVSAYPEMVIITRGAAQNLKNFDIGELATNRGSPVKLFL